MFLQALKVPIIINFASCLHSIGNSIKHFWSWEFILEPCLSSASPYLYRKSSNIIWISMLLSNLQRKAHSHCINVLNDFPRLMWGQSGGDQLAPYWLKWLSMITGGLEHRPFVGKVRKVVRNPVYFAKICTNPYSAEALITGPVTCFNMLPRVIS